MNNQRTTTIVDDERNTKDTQEAHCLALTLHYARYHPKPAISVKKGSLRFSPFLLFSSLCLYVFLLFFFNFASVTSSFVKIHYTQIDVSKTC